MLTGACYESQDKNRLSIITYFWKWIWTRRIEFYVFILGQCESEIWSSRQDGTWVSTRQRQHFLSLRWFRRNVMNTFVPTAVLKPDCIYLSWKFNVISKILLVFSYKAGLVNLKLWCCICYWWQYLKSCNKTEPVTPCNVCDWVFKFIQDHNLLIHSGCR